MPTLAVFQLYRGIIIIIIIILKFLFANKHAKIQKQTHTQTHTKRLYDCKDWFPSSIKLTATHNRNSDDSGIRYTKSYLCTGKLIITCSIA